jgi:hypothetical protein
MGTVMEIVDRLLAVLGALSLPVKMAWGVWLVWGLGQLAWFLWPSGSSRARAVQMRSSSSVRPVAVRPPSRKAMATAPGAAPYGTSDFIAALDEEQAAAAESLVSDHSSSYR